MDVLMLDILSRLSAKDVYRVMSDREISKTLTPNHTYTYFFTQQSNHSLLKDDYSFFLQPNWCRRSSTITEFHSLPSKKPSSGVPHEFLHTLKNYPPYKILASSNGLILCRTTTRQSFETELFIFNPVTQSKFTISTPDYVRENPDAEINIAFECKHKELKDSNDDFLLFLFEPPIEWGSPNYEAKFYSREANAWISTDKSFFVGSRPMNFDAHVFHNKALHFLSDCFPSRVRSDLYFRPYIMAYNIENGESRMIRLPNEARKGSHDLTCRMGIYKWGKVSNLDQSICLVILRKGVFTVWYLNDYESNTWFKVLKIRVKKIGIAETEPIFITGFTVMNGDILVFATQRKIYSYGLASENYRTLEEIGQHGFEIDSDLCFTSYSNTFRSFRNDDSS